MVERFQRIMLIANKKIIYNGEASECVEFFSTTGYPVPVQTNPTEHYLNMLTTEYETPEDGENFYELRMAKIHASYDASDMSNH